MDDHIFNIEAMKTQLKIQGIDLGTQVDTAMNGLQALDLVKAEGNYDLIFMDCNMPFMDGYEATSAIRNYCRDEGIPQPRIVAVTGHIEEQFI